MRNSAVTTVAPTGTISIIADCSGGVEPMFSLAFYRNVLKGQEEGKSPMIEINETFEQVARQRGFYSEGLMEQIATEGTLAHLEGIPDDVQRVFVCAHDITPPWHIRMQAAFQKHCDSSISKTINFSHDADPADVEKIYRMAYDLRCKGVTVYRDGCRSSQPMALADSEKKHQDMKAKSPQPVSEVIEVKKEGESARITTETNLFGERVTEVRKQPALEPRELPSITSGIRVRQQTPFGNMHIQITVDPHQEREHEVFAQLGKGGDIATSDLEAICRMISLWLRAGGRLTHVIKQLSGIGSSLQIPTKDGRIMSLGDGLAQGLKKYVRAKERYGLRSLLLGEVDPSELESGRVAKSGGNGNGNGKGNHDRDTHGNGGHDAAGIERTGGDLTLSAATRLGELVGVVNAPRDSYKLKCPECSSVLDTGEGCTKCHSCGYAHC